MSGTAITPSACKQSFGSFREESCSFCESAILSQFSRRSLINFNPVKIPPPYNPPPSSPHDPYHVLTFAYISRFPTGVERGGGGVAAMPMEDGGARPAPWEGHQLLPSGFPRTNFNDVNCHPFWQMFEGSSPRKNDGRSVLRGVCRRCGRSHASATATGVNQLRHYAKTPPPPSKHLHLFQGRLLQVVKTQDTGEYTGMLRTDLRHEVGLDLTVRAENRFLGYYFYFLCVFFLDFYLLTTYYVRTRTSWLMSIKPGFFIVKYLLFTSPRLFPCILIFHTLISNWS